MQKKPRVNVFLEIIENKELFIVVSYNGKEFRGYLKEKERME